jgi:hypothetical protein
MKRSEINRLQKEAVYFFKTKFLFAKVCILVKTLDDKE